MAKIIESNVGGGYHPYLVMSRAEVESIVRKSKSAEAFVASVNAAAVAAGYDPDRPSNYFRAAGIRSVKVWLDGVPMDDLRNGLGLFGGKPPKGCDYVCRGKGFHVRVENHGTIG